MLQTDLIQYVQRPSQYLGNEINAVIKDWQSVSLKVVLAFPDLYQIGMCHQGLPILYHILNQHPKILAERVFAPDLDLETLLLQRRIHLSSLETNTPLTHFDIIGFSLQYELGYTNVLNMLSLSGIPLFASERAEGFPLVIGGGPCAFNPEPVADFFDAILLGDGEEAVMQMAEVIMAWKEGGGSKGELLQALARLQGVYIPSLFRFHYGWDQRLEIIEPVLSGYEHVDKAIVADLDRLPISPNSVVPFTKIVHDRLNLEVARGCTRGCRFCQAGMIYRPVRERNPDLLLETAKKLLEATGYQDLSLLSLSTGDYSCLEYLITSLMDEWSRCNVAVSLPSMRVGTLSEETMRQIKRVRKTGFTLAPEGATERLRLVINKQISEEGLLDTAERAFGLGWNLIKLYFMIGLPTETLQDLEAIPELARKVLHRGGRKNTVNVSFAQFVPKAHTPFQWCAQESLKQGMEKMERLKKLLRGPGLHAKWNSCHMSQVEGLLSRGDRRMAGLLVAALNLGCRFDAWSDHFRFDSWQQAVHLVGPWMSAQALGSRGEDEILPWDHLRAGVRKEYLLKEYGYALQAIPTPDCRKVCHDCGVCNHSTVYNVIQNGQVKAKVAVSEVNQRAGGRYRYRVRFSKTGPARYLGHLEMCGVFDRALRRAGLPVAFSQGFHPLPRRSFAEALPLGLESLDEILELELHQEQPPGLVGEKLNAELPAGLTVLSVEEARPGAGKPVGVEFEVSGELGRLDRERAGAFKAAERFPITLLRKKGLCTVDLKLMVSELIESPEKILFRVTRSNGIHINPWEVFQHIYGLEQEQRRLFSFLKVRQIYVETEKGNQICPLN
jgi:radical SAM family uncharacterized protein/radical SAM-linked protein